MKNKLLAALLCLTMLLCLAAGCTGSGDPGTSEPANTGGSSSPSASAEPSASPEPGGGTEENGEISLPLTEEAYTFDAWLPDMPFIYPYVDVWMDNNYSMIAMAEMTNIYFDWTYASDPGVNLPVLVASGDYPDVFFNTAGWYAGGVSRGIEEGVFLAIEDYIEEKIPNLHAILEDDPDVRRQMTTTDGHIGTLYSIYDQYGGGSPTTALVRGDWLDNLGFDNHDMETYDDYHDYLAAAYVEYGAQLYIPYSGVATNNGLISGYKVAGLYSSTTANYPFYQANGEVRFGIIEPEYKEYITMIQEWYSEGLIHEDFVTFVTPSNPEKDPVVNNEVSMFHWNAANAADMLVLMDEGASFLGVKEPVKAGNEGELNVFGMPSTRLFFGIQVSTANRNLDLFFKWCDFGYTEQGSKAFNWGKEGVTYEMVNGKPVFTDLVINNPDGIPFSLAQMIMIQDAAPFLVETFKKYDYYADYVVEAYNMIIDNTDFKNSYFLPTTLALTGEDATTFSTKMGDIGTYIDENLPQFIMGTKSMDEWDAFVKQVGDMDIADCIRMYQDAYDVYLSH